ncbi:MAG: hypothetical protein KGL95_00755, partial [Patescibacteria group bacterium]|nr:hypothetical protein [Patescibacteria group bacterium]
MKKPTVIIIFLVIVAGGGFLFYVPKAKAPKIENNIKISNITIMPTIIPTATTKPECFSLSIISPKPKEKVTSPLSISAIVDNADKNCHWTVFEGQAGKVVMTDALGNVLGNSILKTTEDWTAVKKVNYSSTLIFSKPTKNNSLIL